MEELENLATSPPKPMPHRASLRMQASPRGSSDKVRLSLDSTNLNPSADLSQSPSQRFRSRFMRRRFAEILGQTPILSYIEPENKPSNEKDAGHRHKRSHGRWVSSMSAKALLKSKGRSNIAPGAMSADDQAWVEKALSLNQITRSKK